MTLIYAKHYVQRFTVTPCSKKFIVTTYNVSLSIREDLGPSLLHDLSAELPMCNNREKGDYSCKNLKWEQSIHILILHSIFSRTQSHRTANVITHILFCFIILNDMTNVTIILKCEGIQSGLLIRKHDLTF